MKQPRTTTGRFASKPDLKTQTINALIEDKVALQADKDRLIKDLNEVTHALKDAQNEIHTQGLGRQELTIQKAGLERRIQELQRVNEDLSTELSHTARARDAMARENEVLTGSLRLQLLFPGLMRRARKAADDVLAKDRTPLGIPGPSVPAEA